jgi:uncharacterized protein YbcI
MAAFSLVPQGKVARGAKGEDRRAMLADTIATPTARHLIRLRVVVSATPDPAGAANSPHTVALQSRPHGDVLTAISDGMVSLLKEYYGHGPTRTKSYYADDLVVCVLRGGFSRVEQTLLEGGRGAAVIHQRMEFQELMRLRFEEVIESATGRRVIGFMSGNQQHPDMMCEVFILSPTDLVDSDEIAAAALASPRP